MIKWNIVIGTSFLFYQLIFSSEQGTSSTTKLVRRPRVNSLSYQFCKKIVEEQLPAIERQASVDDDGIVHLNPHSNDYAVMMQAFKVKSCAEKSTE